MPAFKDITGQKFARLTAIEYVGSGKWKCKCDCGNETITYGSRVRNGTIRSCGCIRNDTMKKIGESRRNEKICVICGKKFHAPPTGNITCSKECSKIQKSRHRKGAKRPESMRQKLSQSVQGRNMAALQPAGTEAAKNSPKGGRFETNSSSKWWVLISPDGKHYQCQNLRNFIRENPDIFGIDGSDKAVARVHGGFTTVKQNIKSGRTCQTYKGWSILNWNDKKLCEIKKEESSRT